MKPASFTRNSSTIDARSPRPEDQDIVIVDGVQYRRHSIGGGLVALTATVGPHVRVERNAMVRDYAVVIGGVRLFDESVVEEYAVVIGYSTLRSRAHVGGDAVIRGNVSITDSARVDGNAILLEGVKLHQFAHVSGGIFAGSLTIT